MRYRPFARLRDVLESAWSDRDYRPTIAASAIGGVAVAVSIAVILSGLATSAELDRVDARSRQALDRLDRIDASTELTIERAETASESLDDIRSWIDELRGELAAMEEATEDRVEALAEAGGSLEAVDAALNEATGSLASADRLLGRIDREIEDIDRDLTEPDEADDPEADVEGLLGDMKADLTEALRATERALSEAREAEIAPLQRARVTIERAIAETDRAVAALSAELDSANRRARMAQAAASANTDAIGRLDRRITTASNRIDGAISAGASRDRAIAATSERIDTVSANLDAVAAGVEVRITDLDGRTTTLGAGIDAANERITVLDGRVTANAVPVARQSELAPPVNAPVPSGYSFEGREVLRVRVQGVTVDGDLPLGVSGALVAVPMGRVQRADGAVYSGGGAGGQTNGFAVVETGGGLAIRAAGNFAGQAFDVTVDYLPPA